MKIARSEADTFNYGRDLGQSLKKGDVLSLSGTLGAGKTVLVKGIASALGITDTITSPSFTIMSEYEGTNKLYHIDLYRISAFEELEYLGVTDEFYQEGISVIEWGEKLQAMLPPDAISIQIDILTTGERRITRKGQDY